MFIGRREERRKGREVSNCGHFVLNLTFSYFGMGLCCEEEMGLDQINRGKEEREGEGSLLSDNEDRD